MKSLNFDNLFNGTYVSVKEQDATLQNLVLLLSTTKGEFISDPGFGTNLKKYLYDQNDIVLKDLVIDDIYEAIKLFMPQISVKRSDIVMSESSKGCLSVTIKAVNRLDYTTDLYNIVLLERKA